jgi:STE24 endopeptidase
LEGRPLHRVATVRRGQRLRSAVVTCLVVLGATVLLLTGLLPSSAIRGPLGEHPDLELAVAHAPADLADALRFDAEVLADVAAYRGPRRVAAVASLTLSVLVPLGVALALAAGRGSRSLARLRRIPGLAAQVGVATVGVVLLTALVRLPVTVWAGVVQDGRWGFRTRSVPGWARDLLFVVGGRALLLGAAAALLVMLVRRRPRDWPHRLVLLVAVGGPLVLLLHPLVVHPVLLPAGPLPDGAHRDAVMAVVARSDVTVPVILGEASARTTRRNAVATGLGPSARIVLHDTLLELDPRAVAAIAAHELAHFERRDPLRAALAPVPLVAAVAFVLRRRIDRAVAVDAWGGPPALRTLVASVALVLALAAAATPLTAAVSRTIEHRTDVRSVMLSGDPAAHVALVRTFVTHGLADPHPPRWSVLLWATHPTPSDRIAAVVSVADDLATR